MNNAVASRYPAVDAARPHPRSLGQPRHRASGMSTGKMVWVGVGVLAAIAVAANLKDLFRYIKIASM